MNVIDLTIQEEHTFDLIVRLPDGQFVPVVSISGCGPGRYEFNTGSEMIQIKGVVVINEADSE